MKYFIDNRDSICSIQMIKNYRLKLCKISLKTIKMKSEKLNIMKEHEEKSYEQNQYITKDDVCYQLANIGHIGFEVTDSCNLRCTYCIYGDFYFDHDLRYDKNMDVDKAKLLIDYLILAVKSPQNVNCENNIYVSFYGGEPLLNMSFIKEIVDYTQTMKSPSLKFCYMMTTNAVYLRKYIDFLYTNDFYITISLDGRAENDSYRKFPNGKSSFDIVYNNLKFIQENYKGFFDGRISFNAVVHNLSNFQEAFSFIYHEFGKVPLLSPLNPVGVKSEKKDDFMRLATPKESEENEELQREMEMALGLKYSRYGKLQEFLYAYSGNVFDDYNSLLVKKENMRTTPTATCIPFSKRIFMTVNNKILPCERIGQQFYLGTVTDDGVNIDCKAIADKYNSYYNSLKSQCERCYSKQNCDECMFGIPGLGVNPKCQKFTDKDAFEEMLRKHIDFLAKEPESYRRVMTEILIVK